jgi:hypothetical protein
MLVEAQLKGPFLADTHIVVPAGQPIPLPGFQVAGDYVLEQIRLVKDGKVLLDGTPSSVPIKVIDQVFVTSVSTRPLSLEEIQARGIIIDSSSFQVLEFTLALNFGGQPFTINLPVALPSGGIFGFDRLEQMQVQLAALNQQLAETVELPPELDRPGLNFSIAALPFFPVPDDEDGDARGFGPPPITGLLVIPGNVAFLNQFFSAMVMVANVAPEGTPLVLRDVMASISLPVGLDGVAGTPEAPGDDPLRLARIKGVGVLPVVPVVQAGGDGKLGTADDIVTIGPSEKGDGEFLVEGLKEGGHALNIQIDAVLDGLPSGPVRLNGRAAGAVLVRNPKFAIALSHPRTVRSGEPYELFATITNTSLSAANLVSVTLDRRGISGAQLVSPERVTFDTIPSGGSATARYKLVAQKTGQVDFSSLTTGNGLSGSFVLTTGVGERGVPLAPNAIVLPKTVEALPPDLVVAAQRVLGQGLSVALAPAGSLPPNLVPISRRTVTERGIELAEAGQRVQFGEALPRVVQDLLLDWLGNRRRDDGFDQLMRQTEAGAAFLAEVAKVLGPAATAPGILAYQAAFAQATAPRSAHLLVVTGLGGGTAPVALSLRDGTGRGVGGAEANLPFAGNLRLRDTGGGRSELAVVAQVDSTRYVVEAHGFGAGTFDLGIVIPAGEGRSTQLRYSGVPMRNGGVARVVIDLTAANPPPLLLDADGNGILDQTVAPSVLSIVEDPPQVLVVKQLPELFPPLGTLRDLAVHGLAVAVLFDKPMDPASAGRTENYSVDENRVLGVLLQPSGRLAYLLLNKGIGTLVRRDLTIRDVKDAHGQGLSDTREIETVVSDGGRVFGQVRTADGQPVGDGPLLLSICCATYETGFGETVLAPVPVSQIDVATDGSYAFDYVTTLGTSFILEAQDPRTKETARREAQMRGPGDRMLVNLTFIGKGRVRGRVLAADGVTPVPGATVGLQPNPAFDLSDAQRIPRATTANALGEYVFSGVPVGSYAVSSVDPKSAFFGQATGLLSRAGQETVTDVVLSVSGDRFGRLTGRVFHSDGQTPVAEAQVYVGFPRTSTVFSAVGQTMTDATGAFSFDALQETAGPPVGPQSYDVVAVAPGTQQVGRTSGIKVIAGATSATVVVMEATGSVAGVVRNARVEVVPGALIAGGIALGVADANGLFRIDGVPAGLRTLHAGDPVTKRRGSKAVTVLPGQTVNVAIELEARATIVGRVLDANGQPVPRATVRLPSDSGFTFVFANNSGVYRLPDLHLGEYLIQAPGPPQASLIDFMKRVGIDPRSAFTAGDIPPELGGPPPTSPDEVLAAFNEAVETFIGINDPRLVGLPPIPEGGFGWNKVQLFQDSITVSADVSYLAQGLAAGKTAIGEDAPTALPTGALVRLKALTVDPKGFPFFTEVSRQNSDAQTGAFQFGGIPRFDLATFQTTGIRAGDFTLEAATPFSPMVVQYNNRLDSARLNDTDITLLFRPSAETNGTVSGTVLMPDGVTRAPAGTQVQISFGDLTVTTDDQGRFVSTLPIPGEKTYTVTALEPQSGLRGQALAFVAAGRRVDVVVRLLGLGALTVTVKRPDGPPVADAKVTVERTAFPLTRLDGTTNADGVVQFGNLPEGPFGVMATELGTGLVGRASVTVSRDEDASVLVTLAPSGRVDGQFVEVDAVTPVADAQVELTAGTLKAYATTDAAGRFTLLAIPIGDFTVTGVNALTGRMGRAAGALRFEGDTTFVTLVELPRGTVEGTVLKANGVDRVPGAAVSIQSTGSGSMQPLQAATRDDGGFSFPGVSVGDFTLAATDPQTGLSGEASGTLRFEGETVVQNVRLEPVGAIEVTIVDGNGSPVGNASIALAGGPDQVNRLGTTNPGGVFLFDRVRLGSYTLAAHSLTAGREHDGGTASAVVAAADQLVPVTIALRGVGTVSVAVVAADGATPVASAQVTLDARAASGDEPPRPFGGTFLAFTDASGAVSIPGVPVGDFSVRAESGPLAGVASGTIANRDEVVPVTVRLGAFGSIRGRVLLPNGATPAAQAYVTLRFQSQSTLQSGVLQVTTGLAGTFSFTGIPLGAFTLRAFEPVSSGVRSAAGSLTTGGQEVDLGDLVLDNISPRVAAMDPAPGAIGVSPATTVILTFSEPMNADSLSEKVTLREGSTLVGASASVSSDGVRLTLTPQAPLESNTLYTVTVAGPPSGPTDLEGLVLPEPFVASFLVRDSEPPLLVSVSPGNGEGTGTCDPGNIGTREVLALPQDHEWAAWRQNSPPESSASITSANPRAGQGSLELTKAPGDGVAFILALPPPGLGRLGDLAAAGFDWYIDPSNSHRLPPEVALRVYPYGDPRSFFLFWNTCDPACDDRPVGSWQRTDLLGRLSIQGADGNPPPASLDVVSPDAPITDIHVRASFAFDEGWHGFVDNVTLGFRGREVVTYNFDLSPESTVRPDRTDWPTYTSGGASVAITRGRARSGDGSLELTRPPGDAGASVAFEPWDSDLGTFGGLSAFALDWEIDAANGRHWPPDVALRLYRWDDPRSFFLHWDGCSENCVDYPTGSWQTTSLLGRLAIQPAGANAPPTSLAEIPADAPIVGIHLRPNSANGEAWHGFADNVTIGFGGAEPVRYNFEPPLPDGDGDGIPDVSDNCPAPQAVPLEATIRFTFSESIAPGFSLTVLDGQSQSVPGRIDQILGGTAIVFTPTALLRPNQLYAATLDGVADLAGNALGQPIVVRFRTLDTEPPVLTGLALDGTPSRIAGSRVTVVPTVVGDDVARVEYQIAGQPGQVSTTPPYSTTVLLPVGSTTAVVTATAVDLTGNRSSSAVLSIPVVENLAPTVTLARVGGGSTPSPGSTAEFRVTASDDLALDRILLSSTGAVTVSQSRAVIGGAAAFDGTFDVPIPLEAVGSFTVQAVAVDSLGQLSSPARIVLTVGEPTAPSLAITSPAPDHRVVPGPLSVVVQATDDSAIATLSLVCQPVLPGCGTFIVAPPTGTASHTFTVQVPLTLTAPATLTLSATATDASGNVSPVATLVLGVRDAQPPHVVSLILLGGTRIGAGDPATVRARATDAIGVTRIAFDVQGAAAAAGEVAVTPPVTDATVDFTFEVPDTAVDGTTATIRARAFDAEGNASAEVIFTVQVGDIRAPVVRIEAPLEGTSVSAGATVEVVVSATDNRAIHALSLEASGAVALSLSRLAQPPSSPAMTTFQVAVPAAAAADPPLVLRAAAQDTAGNTAFSTVLTLSVVPDAVPPQVSEIAPGDGAIDVPLNTVVVVRFTEAIQAASVVPGSVRLFQDAAEIPGTVAPSGDALSVTFAPTQPLAELASHTVRVEGLRDLAGNTMAGSVASSFTTGQFADTTSPVVLRTSPAQGASGVPVNAPFRIEFSERMDPATLTTASVVVYDGYRDVPGMVQVDPAGTTASFIPANPFAVARSHQVSVGVAAIVNDAAGNPMAGQHFHFTTARDEDLDAPGVVATSPPDGAVDVPTNARAITLDFNEPLDILSAVRGVSLVASSAPVPGAVALSEGNRRVTLTAQEDLVAATTYTVTADDRVTDLAGNPLSPRSFTFTTGFGVDVTGPVVESFEPGYLESGVGTNVVVRVRFSERMNRLSLGEGTFRLQESATGALVASEVVVSGDGAGAELRPLEPLSGSTLYSWTLIGFEDLAGNVGGFGSSYFYTGEGGDTTGPVVLGVSPGNGQTDVAVNAQVVVRLNESVSRATLGSGVVLSSVGGSVVPGTVEYGGSPDVVVLRPSVVLSPNTQYLVSVSGLADLSGNVVTPFASVFTTGSGEVDQTGPGLVSVSPENGATDVGVGASVVMTFSEAIDPTLSGASLGVFVYASSQPVAGSFVASGPVLTFTPQSAMPGGTQMLVSVSGERDLSGNVGFGVQSFFTTEAVTDATAPRLLSILPSEGATGIGLNAEVVLTFSESMNSTTLSPNVVVFVNGVQQSVGASVSADGRTVRFRPSLLADALVTVVVTRGVTDLSGNALEEEVVSHFTTAPVADRVRPWVVGQRPGSGSVGVPVGTSIVLYASEAASPATVEDGLFVSVDGGIVGGTVRVTGAGRVIEFLPNVPWPNGALVEVFLEEVATDLSGNAFTTYQGSFRTQADPRQTAPSLVRTSPAIQAAQVPLNALVDLEFDEALDPGSVSTETVFLREGSPNGADVPVVVSLRMGGRVVRLVPSGPLSADSIYYSVLTTGLRDLDGVSPAAPTYSSYFFTGTDVDQAAPAVVSVSPPDGTTGVGVNASIRVRFSEAINPLTVTGETVRVTDGVQVAVPSTIRFGTGNQDVEIVPHAPLTSAQPHTIMVSGVEDPAGNAVVPRTTGFTTGAGPDTEPPSISNIRPSYGQTEVPVNVVVEAQITEPVDPSGVDGNSFYLYDTVTGLKVPAAVSLSGDGKTLMLVPGASLSVSRTYQIYVNQSGTIMDLSGNPLAFTNVFYFQTSFEVDTVPPQVLGTNPENGQTDVPTNVRIVVNFDEPIDPASVSQVTLTGAGARPVTYTLSDGNRTLTLTPVAPLQPQTPYTLTVNAVQDLAGNTSPSSAYTFTTGFGIGTSVAN